MGARACSHSKWLHMALESGSMLTLNTHKVEHLQHCFRQYKGAYTVQASALLYIDTCDRRR